jgi:hypothetical protein
MRIHDVRGILGPRGFDRASMSRVVNHNGVFGPDGVDEFLPGHQNAIASCVGSAAQADGEPKIAQNPGHLVDIILRALKATKGTSDEKGFLSGHVENPKGRWV